jgi:Ca2+-transporting ATPase
VESVTWCRKQGIRVVMITGDHPQTAFAIAQKAGIAERSEQVMNGTELEALTDEELTGRLDGITVFSRIAPTHKLRIINAFRARGFLTAMTGDGVNDAPALHRADIGISMGKGGTDVAREASHLVLMDDNFATIVDAVQEGRATVSSLRRVISYLFSCGVAQSLLITLSVLLRLPLPLFPGQIIWINLVTATFLDVSLGMEPRHGTGGEHGGKLIDRRSLLRMLYMGGVMGLLGFTAYVLTLHRPQAEATTATLTAMAVFQWFNAWNARSETRSLFKLSPFANRYLLAATAIVAGLQLLAVYAPFMHKVLHTAPIPPGEWGIIFLVALGVTAADEVWKHLQRRRPRHAAMAA